VVLFWHVQVGLLEDEGHAEHTLVKVDDRLAVRAYEGDVVDTLGLNFGHLYISKITSICGRLKRRAKRVLTTTEGIEALLRPSKIRL
jgi:hypothetical protein